MDEDIKIFLLIPLGIAFVFILGFIIGKSSYNKYDLTGDGIVNSADMLKLQRYIISQEYKYDVNQDGVVDARDYIAIKNHIIEGE